MQCRFVSCLTRVLYHLARARQLFSRMHTTSWDGKSHRCLSDFVFCGPFPPLVSPPPVATSNNFCLARVWCSHTNRCRCITFPHCPTRQRRGERLQIQFLRYSTVPVLWMERHVGMSCSCSYSTCTTTTGLVPLRNPDHPPNSI